MTKDKERDDALIAEALMGVVNATRAYLPPDGIDEKTCINRILEATDNPEMARIIQRIEERQPKPDRAEALAWMIEGLFAEAADNPCTCASDENSCPHCNAWERATKQTRACIVEAIDELRAEWEAERPAVVVPREAKLWADSVGYCSATRYEERTTAKWIKSLDGAKGPAVVVPEETGWLVETKFGPHIHYMGIKDPHPYWRKSRKKDEEFEPYGRRALVGLLSFNKDSNDGLRFARKVDAEAFIAAFGQLLTDPKATEHIWADKHIIDGAKGGE